MGEILLFICVIYQIVITTALGGVTLPFSELIGKVTPIKPTSSSSSPPITKSSLTWNGEDIMPKMFSPVAGGSVLREFSSPLAVTSSSKALPVPKIDSSAIANVKMPERLSKKHFSTESKSCRPTAMPEIALPCCKPYAPNLKVPNSLPCNSLLDRITSLPVVTLERGCNDLFSSASKTSNILAPVTGSVSKGSSSSFEGRNPSTKLFNSNTILPLDPTYSMPYPLYYKSLYLPQVRTPAEILAKCKAYAEAGRLNFPKRTQNIISPKPVCSDFAMPYLDPVKTSEVRKPLVQVPKASQIVPYSKGSNANFASAVSNALPKVPLAASEIHLPSKPSKTPSNSLGKIDCPTKTVTNILPIITGKEDILAKTIKIPQPCLDFDNVSSLKQVHPETLRQFSPPIIPSEPIPSISSGTSSFPPISYHPSTIPQTSATPVSFITTAPASFAKSSSKIVSSINNIVSNIAKNILSSYSTHVNSSKKNPMRLESNPYITSALKPELIMSVPEILPAEIPVNTQFPSVLSSTTDSVDYVAMESPSVLILDAPASFQPSEAPIEVPSSQILAISSPPPLTATVLPSSITVSYPICPSYLPSPIIPSYPTISSPFYMEPLVYKMRSPKKDSRDLDKLIELMVLSELFDNDDGFDWDDLDTLLALLSIS